MIERRDTMLGPVYFVTVPCGSVYSAATVNGLIDSLPKKYQRLLTGGDMLLAARERAQSLGVDLSQVRVK